MWCSVCAHHECVICVCQKLMMQPQSHHKSKFSGQVRISSRFGLNNKCLSMTTQSLGEALIAYMHQLVLTAPGLTISCWLAHV